MKTFFNGQIHHIKTVQTGVDLSNALQMVTAAQHTSNNLYIYISLRPWNITALCENNRTFFQIFLVDRPPCLQQ